MSDGLLEPELMTGYLVFQVVLLSETEGTVDVLEELGLGVEQFLDELGGVSVITEVAKHLVLGVLEGLLLLDGESDPGIEPVPTGVQECFDSGGLDDASVLGVELDGDLFVV